MDKLTKGKKVACPRSLDNANLLTDFKLHFATPEEIAANGGVCKKCRKEIQKHGKAILAGKIEKPGAMVPPPPQMPDDHAAWQRVSGENWAELTQTTDFDYDAVDEALRFVEAAPADARAQAGEVIRQVFAYCFGRGNLTAAAAKFAVIGAGLRPDVLDDATQTDLANRLGLTKAALSKASVKFQSAFGVKFSRSRSLSARAKMRARRTGGPDRHRKADGQAGGMPVALDSILPSIPRAPVAEPRQVVMRDPKKP
jgi:hypothetical protein